MHIPRYWARLSEQGRSSRGWSETSASEAERMARERLQRQLALGAGPTPLDWDYYPSTPIQEEILETRSFPGVKVVVTRNRAGALVLNTDRVAFVDIDLHSASASGSLLGMLGGLFRKPREAESPVHQALARVKTWCEERRARLRAYRTAGGLRLLRLDQLLDPAGEECGRMFLELAADPQYARLCRVQGSFRARLSPKPARVDCASAPGSHPRTEASSASEFRQWLEQYEQACAGFSVCSLVAEVGSGTALAPAQAVAALHDERTLRAGGGLA